MTAFACSAQATTQSRPAPTKETSWTVRHTDNNLIATNSSFNNDNGIVNKINLAMNFTNRLCYGNKGDQMVLGTNRREELSSMQVRHY